MDPLHITEFASDRYFEKLNQLKDAHAAGSSSSQHQQDGQVLERKTSATQGPFILPIRASREELEDVVNKNAQKVKEKRGFLGFRSRKSAAKVPTTHGIEQHLDRRPSVAESTKQSLPFDQLFLHLPNELQVQIICSLPLSDILSLRQTSRSLHALITLNETTIVRYLMDNHIPTYARRLYPAPTNTPLSFHYICGIWHRLHVAAKLSDLMCEWIVRDIFLRTSEEKRREFAPQRERMRRRLIPLLFTIFHFFETYRAEHIRYIEEHGYGLSKSPYTINPVEAKVMSQYDNKTLLMVHQVFPLVISSFCRRLRPPTYVGRVEKTFRGYLKDKPADEIHAATLCIGGLRQVERFWEVKGYNTRRTAVDVWYNSIAKDPIETEQRKKRGIMSLGRKKSSTALSKQMSNDLQRRGSWDDASNLANNYIFHTSLAAGMPMGPLGRDQVKMLLSDLPVLQQIWLATAETLVLDRKIVQHPAHIKRNAEVMLELIREDGVEEEDEWLYGTSAPESVRANLEAIREDTLE
ncbi:hypothetical protein DL546_006043 [Coniochaeta pulveracea]|uniref:F-box domain-containing protein n=1 Tax=Coniochaeta pulveracea TaxID=177199 RepID=A0A420Y4A1_9PEZI|nr:hypothetical protein DL546_006043 [Coniochaeta pulveracea]